MYVHSIELKKKCKTKKKGPAKEKLNVIPKKNCGNRCVPIEISVTNYLNFNIVIATATTNANNYR